MCVDLLTLEYSVLQQSRVVSHIPTHELTHARVELMCVYYSLVLYRTFPHMNLLTHV